MHASFVANRIKAIGLIYVHTCILRATDCMPIGRFYIPFNFRDFYFCCFHLQNVTVTAIRRSVSLIKAYTMQPATVAIARNVQPIVTDHIVNGAKRIILCAAMVIVSIVIVIRPVRDHCNATARANVNVKQALPAINVTDARRISSILVSRAARHVVAMYAAHWTIRHLVIQKRALVCVRIMLKAAAVKNVSQASSIWTKKISLVVRHASVMAIHRHVKQPLDIRSCPPHRTSTSTRKNGWRSMSLILLLI